MPERITLGRVCGHLVKKQFLENAVRRKNESKSS